MGRRIRRIGALKLQKKRGYARVSPPGDPAPQASFPAENMRLHMELQVMGVQETTVRAGSSRVATYTLRITSERAPEFIDITGLVRESVKRSGLRDGIVVVFSRHTTAAVKINENEPLLIQDMEDFLERVSPRHGAYRHNDFSVRTVNMTEDECPNGHAHCQHLTLSTSESVPLVDGDIQLGRWQSIFMVELDYGRPREVLVQIMGC